jgi:NADH:ubiquinone reductase (H+-translocating)
MALVQQPRNAPNQGNAMSSSQRILIIGSGFAGMWTALGAARLIDSTQRRSGSIEVALISPKPELHLRPRLHEAAPGGMTSPLLPLLKAVGVRHIAGRVERIRGNENCVDGVHADGSPFTLAYDRLVITSGSQVQRPDMPGLREHAKSIDQVDEAHALELHLAGLSQRPASTARNTFVVVGGGFTGIELATELPGRLRALLGADVIPHVILVEQAAEIGPDLGPGPRPVIQEALNAMGVSVRLNTTVASIDADGLVTTTGERIDAMTVIWTAGLRASPLTQQISAGRDRLGRLQVTDALQVPGARNVFAAGDVAHAATDAVGNHALMSCQHAMGMGRIAGYNVAADLLGLALRPYRQEKYVTCLDLGGWGAVLTEGWDRQIQMTGAEAKQLKRTINTVWIYPPEADKVAAFTAADPDFKIVA